jgi:type I restriction enzyme, R subunit
VTASAAHRYEPIALSSESTVVAEFVGDPAASAAYQSEAELERSLVELLRGQAYELLPITSEGALVANLRTQLEALNGIAFSDAEWDRFFTERIAGASDGIVEKTIRIQEDHVQLLKRDDGSTKNITLIDKANIHNNRLQVINQYEVEGTYKNRYDVTILVNGLPMVHIELKRRGVDIREAFNQINRYQRDSFWAGSGLFEYVQLFVISNGTLTKYYSNTTRQQHLAEAAPGKRPRKTSNSFDFTSWWADAANKPIQDLTGFARTFFAKHTLLNILTRYCVLTADRLLLVMRPYQIAAIELILRRIQTSTNHRQLGTTAAGGYVWHTTGSGKTLTSFKTAQLATGLPGVDKVLFVVDRKDLDYQTMLEYDRFEKGAANSNASTAVLKRQLENPNARIIVTTIQKLSTFVNANKGHEIYGGHLVIIFDECHRSQFGDMHTAIRKAFKRYHLFGFTGTPIFAENSPSGGNPQRRTTEQTFGDKLHTYTIVDAITDKNVLPFRIDYVNTIKLPDSIADKQVSAIDTEKALLAPERMRQVVEYILEHFDQKTKRSTKYELKDRRISGFNSLFATASIDAAKRYYNQFFLQQQDRTPDQRLKVGVIFSYAANEAPDDVLDDEDFDTDALDAGSREFLEDAIQDYNEMFATSFDTSADRFQNYYKDLSKRLKSREIDLVIVVNMFLTGFDATTLNTLWVDKNLRAHGLIQAYSRTNRILNSVKTYGNIVSFRDLEEETNDAIALFGNKEARGVVLLRPYDEYHDEYAEKVAALLERFPLGRQIVGEQAQKQFIALFGSILRLRNILQSFDDFAGDTLLSEREVQDYTSVYLDLYAEFRVSREAEKESIIDDVVFEIELVKQVEINVDYILMLVEQHRKAMGGDGDDKEIRAAIERAIDSSPSLRNKKDLIEAFVDSLSASADVDLAWQAYVAARRQEELERIIADENLKPEATHAFVETSFRDGALRPSGTAITKILPPVSRFAPDGGHADKKRTVLEKLTNFFDRFQGLGG